MEPRTTKAERKKQRRRERLVNERSAAQQLDAQADAAVEDALRQAPEVEAASDAASSERVISVEVTTPDAARHLRKRINEAFAIADWSDVIEVWVWEADEHVRAPLSEWGAEHGVEVRLQQRPAFDPLAAALD